LIASILLGLGVILLIGALHPYGIPWHAYPLPARIAVWSAALLSGSLVALWFSKRAGFWGLGSGAWIFWGLVSFLLAVFLPGAAIVFLVPVLAAVFLLGIGTIFRGPIVLNAVFITAALGAAVFAFPMALLMEHGIGFGLSPAIAVWVGFAASVLALLYALPAENRRVGHLTAAGAGAVLVASIIAGALVPAYTNERPQLLSLVYALDHDQGAGLWAAGPWMDLPESLLQVVYFDRQELVHPLSARLLMAGEAPLLDIPAPTWQIISNEIDQEGQVLSVRLHSPRGADQVELAVPVENLLSIVIADHTFEILPGVSNSGYYQLRCIGRSCGGLETIMTFTGSEPGEFILIDQSYGLPPEGQSLAHARQEGTAISIQDGDVTLVFQRVRP
jgi:hypothetical protein